MKGENITISLCMIVKDEESTLGRCLNSVKDIVDEIIIVDTGSKDNTKEIAKEFNAKIFDFDWIDDFSAARNYSFSKSTKDYILWLDGDDYIDAINRKKLKLLKENFDKSIDVVTMNYSLTRDERGNTTFSLKRNRLVKREKNFTWKGRVHEYLEVNGRTLNSDITINHNKMKVSTDRNLKIFIKMIEDEIPFTARDMYYYSNELYYNQYYDDAITNYEDFLANYNGWIEDKKAAFNNLIRCYRIKGKDEMAVNTVLRYLREYKPTGEICCSFADLLDKSNKVEEAIFWYETALKCIPEKDNLGFNNKAYYTWVPAINLAVCYSKIQNYEKAFYYNELASLYGGDLNKINYNRKFLERKFIELEKDPPKLKIHLKFDRWRR